MVSSSGRYFGRKIQVKCGVTQPPPLSPTIYNTMVDAVLYNWVSVVVDLDRELIPEDFGRDIQRMMSYLNVENGLLTYTSLDKLQRDLHVLTDLFDHG